jgi:hypothetical protein
MKINPSTTPLVRLPEKAELVLYLIKQELKSNKFFNTMAELGGGDSYYRPCLDTVILSYSGFADHSDDLLEFYVERIDHYSNKIGIDETSLTKYAFKLLVDLEMEKQKRKYTNQEW